MLTRSSKDSSQKRERCFLQPFLLRVVYAYSLNHSSRLLRWIQVVYICIFSKISSPLLIWIQVVYVYGCTPSKKLSFPQQLHTFHDPPLNIRAHREIFSLTHSHRGTPSPLKSTTSEAPNHTGHKKVVKHKLIVISHGRTIRMFAMKHMGV
jgi:hypothetical protein